MKLAGFVVLGLVVTVTVFFLVLWIFDMYLPGFAGGGCSNLGLALLFILPFSLLLGRHPYRISQLSHTEHEMGAAWYRTGALPGDTFPLICHRRCCLSVIILVVFLLSVIGRGWIRVFPESSGQPAQPGFDII